MRTPPPRLPGHSPVPPPSAHPAVPARLALPAAGPPFDDQDVAGHPPPGDAGPPGPGPAGPPGPAAGTGARPGAGLPARGWTSLFAQGLAEALAGSRAPRQIAPWTTEQARRRIAQIGPLLPSGQRPVVRRVLTSAPRRDVVEMTVIVGVGPVTRAIAVRLERVPADPARPGRGRPWLCTVIEAA